MGRPVLWCTGRRMREWEAMPHLCDGENTADEEAREGVVVVLQPHPHLQALLGTEENGRVHQASAFYIFQQACSP